MEYFLRYDEGCYGDIYDTLNILLTISASINELPQTICGKPVCQNIMI